MNHIEVVRALTPLIAAAHTTPGLLTLTLDPLHFTQRAATSLGAILGGLAPASWHCHGEVRECASEFLIVRADDLPRRTAAVCCNDPAWTIIAIDGEEMTEAGESALQGVISAELPRWEQVPWVRPITA